MHKSGTNSFLVLLLIVLILFLVGYFLVPFLNFGWLTKVYRPCCQVQKTFQGEQYLPSWCLESKSIEQEQGVNKGEDLNQEELNTNTNSNTNQPLGIANPAAVKCQNDGGILEPYTTPMGTDSLCVFADKSICNEWAYFRAECKVGQCFKECKSQGTSLEGWYNSCSNELIVLADCKTEAPTEDSQPVAAMGSIKVTTPTINEQLVSPFKVAGQAIVFEDKVYVRVKNAAGNVLIEESTVAKHQPGTEWGDFSIEISYEFSLTKEGFVEVYSLDQSGQEANLVRLAVKF